MSDLVFRLRRLDTCVISDALDRHGRAGVVAGLVPLSVPRRIAGRAITVQLGDSTVSSSSRHLGAAAADRCSPDHVVVVAAEGRCDAAGWGGLLSLGASRRGADGIVVDGACRDTDEAVALGLPVYARCAVPVTARGRLAEHSCGAPVSIAGVSVQLDDLVLADRSGVVVVPQAEAEVIIASAESIAAAESAMAAEISRGCPVVDVLSATYENLLARADSHGS